MSSSVAAREGLTFQNDFTSQELAERRRQLAQTLPSDAIAVLHGAPASGAMDMFRQYNDFYYLCGVEVPHAYLTVKGATGESTLYLPPHDEKLERSEGVSLCDIDHEAAKSWTGVQFVKPLTALEEDLAASATVHLPQGGDEGRQTCRDTIRHGEHTSGCDPNYVRPSHLHSFLNSLQGSNGELGDLTPALDQLRLIKSDAEIAMMQLTGTVTALAVTEAMRCTEVGQIEGQLAALADYVFLLNGATSGGYRAIVAGGKNIWNAHYFRNNCPLEDGQLVLMDYAPDIRNYTNDIGRMWPVNGSYTDWQRELYGYVVEYHKAFLQTIKAGKSCETVYRETEEIMRPVVEATNWSNDDFAKAANDMLTSDCHLTHPVGMAVHDVGMPRVKGTLEPGCVFALDPQLWVREQELYIRVEDTVAVTTDGVINFTEAAPLELDHVEQVMREPGIIQARADLKL